MRVFQNYSELAEAYALPTTATAAFRILPSFGPAGFRCADCESIITLPTDNQGCPSGYSVDSTKTIMRCYPCTDKLQLSEMQNSNAFTGYLSCDGKHFTTWTGGVLAKVIQERESKSGFRRSRITHIQAIDPAGAKWHGKGSGRGTCITLRRCKGGRS